MRNILISALVLCVALSLTTLAQSPQWITYRLVNSGTAYANNDVDTISGIPAVVGGFNNVIFEVRAADSISIAKVYIDRSPNGRAAASYSVYDSLSTLVDSHNTGSVVVGTLRGTAVDKLGGVGWQYRIRIAFNSSGNGTTSSTYGAVLNYHR
jgi:hypothetical protein